MHYVFFIADIIPKGTIDFEYLTDFLYQKAAEYTEKSVEDCKKELSFIEIKYQHKIDQQLDQLIKGGKTLGKFNDWLIKQTELKTKVESSQDISIKLREKIAVKYNDFLLNTLIYTRNPEMRNYVLLEVAEKVLSVFTKAPKRSSFSFIGHGLGAKILFDFLHRLYWPDNAPPLPKTKHSPRLPFSVSASGMPSRHSMRISSVYLLANVAPLLSRIDQALYDCNNSHVRVYNSDTFPVQQGIIRRSYRIFNQQKDLIAQLGLNKSIEPKVFTELVKLNTYTQFWMNDIECYLQHPQVYLSLIEDVFRSPIDKKMDIVKEYENEHQAIETAHDIGLEFVNTFEKMLKEETFNSRDLLVEFMKKLSERFDNGSA